jgi:hypothetical protein
VKRRLPTSAGPPAPAAGGVLAATLAALALSAWLPGAGASSRPATAVAAHVLDGNAEAKLRYVRSSGSTLIEEGPVSGGISGHMRAMLSLGATFTGSFRFYTKAGEMRGHGTAHPHGSGRYESFAGTDVMTGGTGRYAHVHGHGSMYGIFDRKTYDVTIQTRGMLHY